MKMMELTIKNTGRKLLVNLDNLKFFSQNKNSTIVDFGGDSYFEVLERYEDIKKTLELKNALRSLREDLRR